jgi:hypothetical protein
MLPTPKKSVLETLLLVALQCRRFHMTIYIAVVDCGIFRVHIRVGSSLSAEVVDLEWQWLTAGASLRTVNLTRGEVLQELGEWLHRCSDPRFSL